MAQALHFGLIGFYFWRLARPAAPELFLLPILCCGGDFATTSTARSKRNQASGCNSEVGVSPLEGFAMQPLSRVKRDADVLFGRDDVMPRRPILAARIADCISAWTEIEQLFGIFLGLVLHANARTMLSMYLALENRAAQLRLIEAVAEAELSHDQFDIFDILMEQHLRPAMKTRDKFVHWCWGYSNQLPDDLILMAPEDALPSYFELLSGKHVDIDGDKAFVITEKYLTKIAENIRVGAGLLALLTQTLTIPGTTTPRDVTALARLSAHHGVATHLAARRKTRETSPAAPPEPPA